MICSAGERETGKASAFLKGQQGNKVPRGLVPASMRHQQALPKSARFSTQTQTRHEKSGQENLRKVQKHQLAPGPARELLAENEKNHEGHH